MAKEDLNEKLIDKRFSIHGSNAVWRVIEICDTMATLKGFPHGNECGFNVSCLINEIGCKELK